MAKLYECTAFGKKSKESHFEKFAIQRGECGPDDVEFDIKFCGICHTDIYYANNTFGTSNYPTVPGHELAGVVVKVTLNIFSHSA